MRKWWQPPTLGRPDSERRAGWLELFYDLVYIAAVIELGSYFHGELTPLGTLRYVFLFLIVWWSWSGTTYYENRFLADDALHRLLVFLQIFFVGSLASSIPRAFGEAAAVFALSYAALRVVLIVMYARAYRAVPNSRPLIRNYTAGFSLGILCFILSAFVPAPWTYVLWGLGIGAEVAIHMLFGTQGLEQRFPFNIAHLSERYALFIIIVLGDSFIKAIGRTAEEGVGPNTYIFGAAGVLMTVSLWWIYFDDVAEAALRQGRASLTSWVYAHFPLSVAIVGFGVAVEDVTQLEIGLPMELPLFWLLYLSVGGYLLATSWVDYLTETSAPQLGLQRVYIRVLSAVFLISFAVVYAFMGWELSALWTVAIITGVSVAQILYDLSHSREQSEVHSEVNDEVSGEAQTGD